MNSEIFFCEITSGFGKIVRQIYLQIYQLPKDKESSSHISGDRRVFLKIWTNFFKSIKFFAK
jgi:hypothetical protein